MTINLGGIKEKRPSDGAGKTTIQLKDYSGHTAEEVDEWVSLKRQRKTIDGQMKVIEGKLKSEALDYMYKSNHNKDRPDSTVEAVGKEGSVKISFQDMYSPIQMTEKNQPRIDELEQAVGHHFNETFKKDFVLSIVGSQIPEAQRQAFVNDLNDLMTLYGADNAVEAKQTVAPLKDIFHVKRHTLFTPEENMKLNALIPVRTMIR